jgi:hypothetical protein
MATKMPIPSEDEMDEGLSIEEKIKQQKMREQAEEAYNKSDMNPDSPSKPKPKPKETSKKELPLLPSEMAKGGKVRSIDGIAQRGKTRARRG